MPSNDQSLGCCDEPPCPTVTLLCNSISASKSKCGFSEFGTPSSPPKKYLTKTTHAYGSVTENYCGSLAGQPATRISFDYTQTDSYDANCNVSCSDASGSCSRTNYNADGSVSGTPYSGTYSCSGFSPSGCPTTAFCGGATDSTTHTTTTTSDVVTHFGSTTCISHGADCTYSRTVDQELSDEYDTATLKTNTESALPAYADCFSCTSHSTDSACTNLITGQGCTCSAFANLSTDETSYTIRRFKYKFRFTGAVTCRLKILWNETFKPTLTAAVDFCSGHYAIGAEDPDPSHWTKTAKTYTKAFSGDPCGPDAGSAPTAPIGDITEFDSGEYTVNEPSSNGTTYITDIRWTILDGNNDTDIYNPAPIDYFNPCAPVAAEANCIPSE